MTEYEIVEELECEYCGSNKILLSIEEHGVKSILCKECRLAELARRCADG